MKQTYVIINKGTVDNIIIWDKKVDPTYRPNGKAIVVPTLTTVVKGLSGKDTEITWHPGIGDKYYRGKFIRKSQ